MPKKTRLMLEIEQRFGKNLEEILKEEYVVNRMSAYDIAEKFKIGSSAVYQWLRYCNIPIRCGSEARWPDVKKPSEEQLWWLYVDKRLSSDAIAEKLRVSAITVSRWLRECGIRLRSVSEAKLRIGAIKPSKEKLRQLYVIERLNTYDIAEKIGVSPCTVGRWLKGYGIRIKSKQEARWPDVKKPSKEQLVQLYIFRGTSATDIGKKFGVKGGTVVAWLSDYDIPIRSISEAKLPPGFVKPSKEQLKKWYFDERLSTYDIAKKLMVSDGTVSRWLRECGMQIRNASEAKLPPGFVKPSKKQLNQWYIVERNSTYDIAEKLGVSSAAVYRWLHGYGIRVRNMSENQLPVGFVKPLKKQLKQWYINERMTTQDIAEKLKVSAPTVCDWLHKYSIPIRDGHEAHLPVGFVMPSKDELRKWYVTKGMSTVDIAKKLGVHSGTVGDWLCDYGIRIRSMRETRWPHIKRPSKKQLKQWYTVEGMTTYDVSRRHGISYSTVYRLLSEYGIPVRGRSNVSCSKDAVKELLKCYVGEKKYAS